MVNELVLISKGSVSKAIAEALKNIGVDYREGIINYANQAIYLNAGGKRKRKSKRKTYNLKEVQ